MRLVYAGNDEALYSWRPGRRTARRITWDWEEIDGRGARTRLSYQWPTCSPDGMRILTFARRGSNRHFVYVVDAAGVETTELATLGEASPIYGNWSPDGAHVAILVQRRHTLSLEILTLGAERPPSVVARGAPLFWSWAPDGRTLAIQAGQSTRDLSTGGTYLLDARSGEVRRVLSGVPALFRTPSWSADGRLLAFARLGESATRLVLLDAESDERRSREVARGPLAFVWHPSRPVLAYGVASDQAPHMYGRVVVLDLREDREWVIVRPTLAFFWHPHRLELFRLGIDQDREELSWEASVADGASRVLARFVPTRETVFMASFFDQYACSHSPVASDGSAVTFAGRVLADRDGTGSRVYVVPTTGEATAQAVGDGIFAVWGP